MKNKDLAITAMLEERLYSLDGIGMSDAVAELEALERFLPQVRQMEEAQQKKAKEEERLRIVGILDEMKSEIFFSDARQKAEPYQFKILEKAIERISNLQ